MQRHGFVIGSSFGLRRFNAVVSCWVCNATDTASLATRFLFDRLFCIATLFAFGKSGVVKIFRSATQPMTNSDRTQQLRDDFSGAFDRARASLKADESAAGLIELYDHGLVTSMEILSFVWEAFYNDDAARNRVCDQLRAHPTDAIQRIPDAYDEPGFRKHRSN